MSWLSGRRISGPGLLTDLTVTGLSVPWTSRSLCPSGLVVFPEKVGNSVTRGWGQKYRLVSVGVWWCHRVCRRHGLVRVGVEISSRPSTGWVVLSLERVDGLSTYVRGSGCRSSCHWNGKSCLDMCWVTVRC